MNNNHLSTGPWGNACRGASWVVVLPDCDSAGAAAALLSGAPRVERHASGRPWLVGSWAADDVTLAAVGGHRLAVFGPGCTTPAELADVASRMGDIASLDRLAGRLPGSFHLVASVAGMVRFQGSVSGLRRVFYTRVAGVDIAADRADVLAAATDAGVAPERLASCLLVPEAPYPLEGEVMWRGVHSLREDHYLLLDPDRPARPVRWWTAPEPELPLAEGAQALRAALTTAAEVRARTGRTLSCDLSGGLDSTPVCHLTAAALHQRGEQLITVTTTNGDPDDDDPAWADIAATAMPNLRRIVIPPGDMPLPYADLLRPGLADDEPLLDPGGRADLERMVQMCRELGSELHLTGDGGDEVLEPEPSYLRELVRTRPWRAANHLRGYRALYRWSWRTTLRFWTDRRTYGEWLSTSADMIAAAPPTGGDTRDGPGHAYRLPPWATPDAADLLRARVRQTAAEAELLGATLSQHEDIEAVRMAGHDLRRINNLSLRFGLPRAAPYLDDRVIEACLSVRADERATPWRYKPLIVEAMRGLMPDEWLRRTTKADGTELHHAGMRAHRALLTALCDDSELARLGLVDPDKLRAHCTGMWASSLWPVALTRTLGLERWLRDLNGTGTDSGLATTTAVRR